MTVKHDINSAWLDLPSGNTFVATRCIRCQSARTVIGKGSLADMADMVRDMREDIEKTSCAVAKRDGST